MDSALRRWEVAGPQVRRLQEEYELQHNITSNENKGKHHKYYIPSFRKLSLTSLKNYFSTLMKFATLSRRIDWWSWILEM